MHQAAISLETFAAIFEHLHVVGRDDRDGAMTTTGRHPALGSVVVLQDINPELILLSERPLPCLVQRHSIAISAQQHEATS
jgi:hypothetical protein